jgi:predicted nucleic acid-binding protein
MVRQEISNWKSIASKMANYKESILKSASGLVGNGFGKKDALHIASAIELKVDYFLTVDKGILRKRTMVEGLSLLSPIEFLAILEETNAS